MRTAKASFLLSTLAAGLLASCAAFADLRPRAPACAITPEGDLRLIGSTDARMLACVKAKAEKAAARIVVTSPGGSVTSAIAIAEQLKLREAEIVVRGACNSSCANYFLPVARRVTLEAGAAVILHGSIDEHMLTQASARDAFDLQARFAASNGIHLGWLMYRTEADFAARRNGRFLRGTIETWAGAGSDAMIAFVAVEESMMRSCLKGVEIASFQDTLAQRLHSQPRFRQRMAKRGIYPSGTLRCVTPTEAGVTP